MRLVVGQRLWTGYIGESMRAMYVTEVGRQTAYLNNSVKVPASADSVRYVQQKWQHGSCYYTDGQRAVAEEAQARASQEAAVAKACSAASLETLNAIAAVLGIPPVVAWAPEKT